MKKIIAVLLTILMLFSLFQGALRENVVKADETYQWVPINNGLTNLSIKALVIDPNMSQVIYAGTDSGVFKSTDGGATWRQINIGLTNTKVECLAIDPNNTQIIYAGTLYGVFKSDNGGTSWTQGNNNGLIDSGATIVLVFYLIIDPVITQTIYAGVIFIEGVFQTNGVFKSTDGGATWIKMNEGIENVLISSFAIDSTNTQIIYAGSALGLGIGVFKSTNGGTSWLQINDGLTNTHVWSLAIDPNNAQILYAGTKNGLIFKSTNGGTNWNQLLGLASLEGTYIKSIAIDPTSTQIIYAARAVNGGVFKSTNGGTSWLQINDGLTNNDIRALVIDRTNTHTIYAGTYGGGVFKLVPSSSDFSISASPSSQSVTQGNSTTYTVTLTSQNGFSSPVSLSIPGLTPGLTYSFNPSTVTPTGSSTLTISTSQSTPAGSYPITITASGGGKIHTATVTLTVTSVSVPDFSISVSPWPQSVTQGNSVTFTTTLTSQNGFSSPVSLSIPGLTSGLTYSFNPSTVTPTGNSTLTIYTSQSTPTGSYTITISASGGGKTHAATFVLNVIASSGFTIDIWVDRECGSTYQLGDYIRIYGRASATVDATYIVQRPDGTFSHTMHLNANTDTVLGEGSLDGPTGQRTYTLRATYGGETKEKSCSINVGSSTTTLTVDIWVDKGCGSTYKTGESGRVYLKTNMDAYIELYWSTNGSTPELFDSGNVTANNTYYDDFTIAAPVGTEVVTIKATAGGQTATKSCTFYSVEDKKNPPTPPQNLKATFSESSITLTWTASTKGTYNIAGYAIYRGTSSGGESSTPIVTVLAGTTTYEDKNVTLGTTYYYYVKAYDTYNPPNYSDHSDEVNITFKRLPVLLVHGFQPLPFFHPEKIWNEMAMILSGNNSGVNLKDSNYQYNLWYFKAIDSEHLDVYISDYTHDDNSSTIMSISDYARSLWDEILEIESRERCSKVNIVAHSMGGLVARRYIESKDLGLEHYRGDVYSLIMIGTPNHGTVVADKWVDDSAQSQCAKEMRTYSSFLSDLNKDKGVTCKDKNVNYYTFAGELLAFDNSKSAEAFVLPEDSVVSVSSVALSDSEAPGVRNYTVQYSDHSGLINDKNVCNTVKDILSGKSVDRKIIESNEIKSLDDLDFLHKASSNELYVHCPVNVTVKDKNGRIINTQGINQIPDAYVEVIGEEKFFYLPADLSFTIELDAYDKGNVSLEMLYLNIDTKSISVTAFKDFPINSNTKIVSSTVQTNSVDFVLNVDSDGNGSFDYQKTPDLVGRVSNGTYTITASSGSGGLVSPSGTITLNYGDSKTFSITPNSGYKISNVKVDGASVGAVSSYTFSNIASDHTISATFEKEITQTVIILQIGNKNFSVNGVSNTLDSPPIIKNSRTLLPIRAVVEALGGTVEWIDATKIVMIRLGSTTIQLQIGNANALVNGANKLIDPANPKVVPEIINGRTMLPVRFITENLGCDVQWDGITKTITITYPRS